MLALNQLQGFKCCLCIMGHLSSHRSVVIIVLQLVYFFFFFFLVELLGLRQLTELASQVS